jgi:uncharacterized membrane protein
MTTSFLNRNLGRYNSPARTNKRLPGNISFAERAVSVAAGANLIASGLLNIFSHPIRNLLVAGAGGYLVFRGATGYCPVYNFVDRQRSQIKNSNVNIRTSVFINKPRQEVYDFWRNLENLPLFMTHLKSVKQLDGKRSHWESNLPGNLSSISWEAEIVSDNPGSVIGWRSIVGSEIDNAGKVEFADAADGQGTVVQVVISYLPPKGGFIKSKIADLLSPVFERMVRNDINNFKHYIENRFSKIDATNEQHFGHDDI